MYDKYANPNSYIALKFMNFAKLGIHDFLKFAKTMQNLQIIHMDYAKLCKFCMKCILTFY